MPRKDQRIFGNRTVAPADLRKYESKMTERHLAEYLGISHTHARRHRSPLYRKKGVSWPKVRREGGERSPVFYRRVDVLEWVKTLPRQD